MTKLNQILAEEKTVKSRCDQVVTRYHHDMQKKELLAGLNKTYEPATEDANAEKFPPETQRVQLRAKDGIKEIQKVMAELFKVTAKKDYANTLAKSDIVVDGVPLALAVPATHLLWLDKQLTLLKSVVEKLPALDPAEVWTLDSADGLHKTAPVKRVRTEKIQKPEVLLQPTKEHPGQAVMVTTDKTIGYWTHIKLSGALPADEIAAMSERLDKVIRAVKVAKAHANAVDVSSAPDAASALDYVFNGYRSPQI